MEKNVDAFIEYLKAQVGEPYLWGGQHTRLTPENYKAVIERRESDPKHRAETMAFCEKKFRAGATVLYAYDCSGLGCYWLYNLRGWWVFRLSGQRASHIGYMIDDEYLIEAKGRKYGVVKTKFRPKDWACWGIPKVFEKELTSAPAPEPEPQPEPPAPVPERFVEVVGGSVNVRTADSKKGRILFTAHRGDTFPFLATAPSGWYEIDTKKGPGFITNLARYTKLI